MERDEEEMTILIIERAKGDHTNNRARTCH